MTARYIVRLDDACETMDHAKWGRIEMILDRHDIKPIVAVIPANNDPKMKIGEVDAYFWTRVRGWADKGWEIALHGYDHVYITKELGLVPMNAESEFAGLPLDVQREKIRKGLAVFHEKNIESKMFVAPSHTLDLNTLEALRLESDIRVISDGVAYYPYEQYGFVWIPQQLWGCVPKKKGVWTICLHPNVMADEEFLKLEVYLEEHAGEFVSDYAGLLGECQGTKRTLRSKWLSRMFFLRRFLSRMQ